MAEKTEPEQAIAELEKEIMEKSQRLQELRRGVPRTAVEDYALTGPGGEEVRLSQLFGDKKDLILIHNMGKSCPYCTLWADSFNGLLAHYKDRAAFALVSPDTPETQREFADSRGWKFAMLCDGDHRFTREMGFWGSHQPGGEDGPFPGFSTFRRTDDGKVERVAHDWFGPGDPYLGIWHMFGLLDKGADGWEPKYTY